MDTNRWTRLTWKGLGLTRTVALGLILTLGVLLAPSARATSGAQPAAAASQPTAANATTFQSRPVEQLLKPDGTLNVSTGWSGTLDLRGWGVTLDSGRGPLFTRRGNNAPPHAPQGISPDATWQALPHDGLTGEYGGVVSALAVSGGDLYVSGNFTQTADGAVTNLNNIARYSDGAWSPLPNNGLNGPVSALVVSGSDLYVGGWFTQSADGSVTNLNYIARYSNGAWSALPNGGLNYIVVALAVSGSDLYVGGYFTQSADMTVTGLNHIAKYSGGAWSALSNNGLNSIVWDIAVNGSDLYAGGNFMQSADGAVTNLNNIARYSNGAWSALPHNGLNAQVTALAMRGSDLYAGGYFTQTADGMVTNLNHIARYSGGVWSPLSNNGLNGQVYAFAVSGSDLYVGGLFTQSADGAMTNLNNIARYSDGAWSALSNNGLNGWLYALAMSGSDLYVGGLFTQSADGAVTNLNNIAGYSTIRHVITGGLTSGVCTSWGTACDLQYALSIAASGDEVWVAAGTYRPTTGTDPNATFVLTSGIGMYGGFGGITETVRNQRNWTTHVVTLTGNLSGGAHSYHVVTANGTDPTTTLDGFTITGAQAGNNVGGGVYINGGNLTIANCRIVGNSASYGGGVFQSGTGRVNIIGSFVERNLAAYQGGGLYIYGDAALTDTLVLTNTSGADGGGLTDWAGRTDLTGGLFAGNSASGNGGGVNANNSVSISGTQFISNTASGSGGGLLQWNAEYTVTVTNARFERNTANGDGGALWARGDTTLSGSVFRNNTCTGSNCYGGGLYANNTLTLTGTQFIGNTASNGGGLQQSNAGYTATVTNARFERNTAKIKGGGAVISGTLIISNSTFVTNTVDSGDTDLTYGGGLYAGGTSQILASTFVSNSAKYMNRASYGGGLYASGSATIQDSTFDSNDATAGGGAYSAYTAAITVTHSSTFKNNTAISGGGLYAARITLSSARFISNTATWGGGVSAPYVDAVNALFVGNQAKYGAVLRGSQYTLRHVTIAHPTQGVGPAILMENGTANITDTIIANYTVGISQTGGILNADYDLFFTATPTLTSGGTMNWGSHNLNANPRFANPAAGDYHLAAGSPAIDTGANAGVTTDLDGVTRPRGIGYDIGAYEAPPSSGPCYARLLSNSATYTSTNAAAVQAAVDAAPSGDTVKVAGTCAGVQARTGIAQTVYISKSLTVRGGYTITNWTTSNPAANLTILDAKQGGRVVYLTGGSGVNVTLENLTVRGGFNGYDNYGGGIYDDDARLTLSNAIVRDNGALGGGGVFVNAASATLNVKGGQILSNTADGGGGVYLMYGSATLSGTQILNNRGGGLGIESGSATLSGTQILNNVDGGLFNFHGTLAVVNSTVGDNIADMYSGITNYGTLTITNSTISGNRGTGPVYGVGAIVQGGSATIVNCTIVSNTAGNAAHSGIWLQGGTLTIQNSIVAHNGVTNNVQIDSGTFTSLGYNLTNSSAGTPFTATGDLVNTDPLLGPLQNNGGPSWTHALLPGSPAIDRIPFGVNGCGTTITTDQRGQPRPGTFTRLCDMGAYEAQGIYYRVYLPVVIK